MRLVVIAFFVACLSVIAPIIYYYWRRNPNPRFRPRFGELFLVSLLLVGISGGASLMMASLLGVDPDPEKIKEQIEAATSPRPKGPAKDDELFDSRPADSGDSFFPWEKD